MTEPVSPIFRNPAWPVSLSAAPSLPESQHSIGSRSGTPFPYVSPTGHDLTDTSANTFLSSTLEGFENFTHTSSFMKDISALQKTGRIGGAITSTIDAATAGYDVLNTYQRESRSATRPEYRQTMTKILSYTGMGIVGAATAKIAAGALVTAGGTISLPAVAAGAALVGAGAAAAYLIDRYSPAVIDGIHSASLAAGDALKNGANTLIDISQHSVQYFSDTTSSLHQRASKLLEWWKG